MEGQTADQALEIFKQNHKNEQERKRAIIINMFNDIKQELEVNQNVHEYFLERIRLTGKEYYICWQSRYTIASCFDCDFSVYDREDIKLSYNALRNKVRNELVKERDTFFGKQWARLTDIKHVKIEKLEKNPFAGWYLVITKINSWDDFDRRERFGIVLTKHIN